MSWQLLVALVFALAVVIVVRKLARSLWQSQVRLARLEQSLNELALVQQRSQRPPTEPTVTPQGQ